jgi:tRNA (guanine37-N1)-methyltransferase
MRTWAVVVPRERAESVRRDLLGRGLLLKQLRISRESNEILLPTRERVDLGFPTRQAEFDEGFVAIRSYKDVVDVPHEARSSLPSSFDVIGDIAVIKIPEELRASRNAIGDAIRRWNPTIGTVLEDRGVKGEHRIREIDVIAGEPRTTTVHTEHGLHYHVDLAHAYFSPRLASERKRIADLVGEGETVADPFAGVGPYSILIAKRRRPAEVHAADANPTAVRLLDANVAANRAEHVTVHEGDARTVLKRIKPVDRVILDLPHSAMEYLPQALEVLGSAGTVHLYGILEEAEESGRRATIERAADAAGVRVRKIFIRHVRAYSPTKYHTAFDVTVSRA